MPKSSFGVPAEVAYPTGVRATVPNSKFDGDDENPEQGSSNIVAPGQSAPGKNKRQRASSGSYTPEAPISQGSSKISQPPQVTAEDIDVADDVNAIFEGSDLSEDFRYRAQAIFEAAVVSKINEKLEEITQSLEEEAQEIQEQYKQQLAEQVDSYLNYVVENWMEENRLAVQLGVRSELAESFLIGLRELFNEHYVDIPEGKDDVLNAFASRVEELEAALNEETHRNIELSKAVTHYQREAILDEVCEGLTETQMAKIASLSESMAFTDPDEFEDMVRELRNSYFPDESYVSNYYGDDEFDEGSEYEPELSESYSDPSISRYVQTIARTVKK